MDHGSTNYLQGWALQAAERLRQAWNGTLDAGRLEEAFDPRVVFHHHDRDLHGLDAYRRFIDEARAATLDLDLVPELTLGHRDHVLLLHRWSSKRWHPDVVGGGSHSNYCKAVLRLDQGRIAEIWQQAPDFLFLLGKRPVADPMRYPRVLDHDLLVAEEGAVRPADDARSRMLAHLFQRMNDCFMNRASLREMGSIQNDDIEFQIGGAHGGGVASWKTFAYALHTCLQGQKGTRFDDLYVRDGKDTMRVFLRAHPDHPAPTLLGAANGVVASMRLRERDGRIQSLWTHTENYIQFLDTDFTRHADRLKDLFQGRRPAVVEPAAAPAARVPALGRDRVAIIGLAGRFPQCDSVPALWEALDAGRMLCSPLPPQRAYLAQGTDIRHAGFIDPVDRFDAAFFQVLPGEAQFIDPQQRLLLQEIFHAIEHSGHPAADYAGPRTGLFVSTLSEDYRKLLQEQGLVQHPQTWAGNESAMFPAKVARFLDVQGPCHFVNAECASSLVALHQASQMIREGRIDQAIVGATSLLLHSYGFAVRRDALLTDEPAARLFSRNSRGQLRGEAIVAVVLKSLRRAQADGDRILGIVAGSAVNNSGRTLSLVAGSVEQQARAMTEAWRDAGIEGSDLSLIECHASGVRGGDFAELAAVRQALRRSPVREGGVPCRLGTSKGAFGHGEAASGLTALAKVLLQMQHGRILPIHGLDEPDPELPLDAARFMVAREAAPWPTPARGGAPRRAGINGFAAGGYNAHVVIEEAPSPMVAPGAPPEGADSGVVVVSAQSESSLQQRLRELKDWLAAHPGVALPALTQALQCQDAMKYRAAFVVSQREELAPLIDGVLQPSRPLPPDAWLGRRSAGAAPSCEDADPRVRARRWCEGARVAWRHGPRSPLAHVDLPAYPFDTRPLWLPEHAAGPAYEPAAERPAEDHPLLQSDVSGGAGLRYRSTLTGQEAWVADHVVQGQRVLPGVATLEMARAAMHHALAAPAADRHLRLQGVTWMAPVAVAAAALRPVSLEFSLSPLAGGSPDPTLAFELATVDEERRRVHAQGRALWVAAECKAVDLAALRQRFAGGAATADAIYAAYAAMGIHYGPAFRAVRELHALGAAPDAREVLARLARPAAAAELRDCALHPVMMDGAVHAAIGLLLGTANPPGRQPPLPFAVETVDILRAVPATAWAWIRHSDAAASGPVQKLDIDVIDDEGRLCVRLGCFSSRRGDEAAASATARAPAPAAAPSSETAALVLQSLRRDVGRVLQVAPEDIDIDEPLNEFGFDSISLTEFGNRINDDYRLPPDRPLNPTVFFEHPTLRRFAQFLASRYAAEVAARHGTASPGSEPVAPPPAVTPAAVAVPAATTAARPGDVAIIGISGRFPMAEDLDAFWAHLAAGRDCISEVPPERWDWHAIHGNPLREPHATDVRWGGFIDGVAEFDPLFFGISPREAELMDPQQRLLMQHAWAALEDAGYSAQSLAGTRTAVFLGTAASGYTGLLAQAGLPVEGSTITGMVPSVGPNRVSYLLDLHGPSEPIETACSSSLVAVHRALVAMATGTCDMAIVGGVNTVVTPDGHIGFRKAGMICEDGRCKTFSRHANGYVRGEGVGVLVLKRLAEAERDHDTIYAVIKGSAENHGGRAQSLTAPNPNAQADLLTTAWRQSGIDPRTVTYIEAHGTGTELGDPIEVNALKSAFRSLYEDSGSPEVAAAHCGLGSVKSNIGHLELAAGVAGVLKVLMQMRHGTLAASLHSSELNPYLALEGSPFYVVQSARPWEPARDGNGQPLPRRAGVSAFGFGGVNAHVVLEEYRPGPAAGRTAGKPVAVVLSARNRAQLAASAQRLLLALDRAPHRGTPFAEHELADIAYTLQVGREPMEERLGVVVDSLDGLREALRSFVAGQPVPGVFSGAVKAHRELVALLSADDDLRSAVDLWFGKRKLRSLVEMWVKGLPLDWRRLYPDAAQAPRRVSLPTYPFARDRYWVPAAAPAKRAAGTRLHPLLHRNVSDFTQQRYASTFDGSEFFLRDHRAAGRAVLPAAASLELVRAALSDAAHRPPPGLRLRQVTWPAPLMRAAGDPPTEVRLALVPAAGDDIRFELVHGDETAARVLCQGVARWEAAEAPAAVDLAAVRARCTAAIAAPQVYESFARMGLDYGPAHRALAALQVAAPDGGEVLGRLNLPAELAAQAGAFWIHPSMLDAALQTGIGFLLAGGEGALPSGPALPFHLKSIDLLAPCPASGWAWARRVASDTATQTLDIDVCDDDGRICLRLHGFASRTLAEPAARPAVEHDVLLAPAWAPAPVPTAAPGPLDARHALLVGRGPAALAVQAALPGITCVERFDDTALEGLSPQHLLWVLPDDAPAGPADDAIVARQAEGVLQQFRALKALLGRGFGSRPLAWTVVTTQAQDTGLEDAVDATHAGALGLAGSLAKEVPAWQVRALDLPRGGSAGAGPDAAALRQVLQASAAPGGATWAWRRGQWLQCRLAPVDGSGAAETGGASACRQGGVYVVIGGAGGIGEVWTEHVLRHYDAQVVWIGRRPLDDALQARIDRLAAFGRAPRYLQADATRRDSLQAACDAVRAELGAIHGVVHSALVLHDHSLVQMETAEFEQALAAKVDVSVRIAQVFEHEPLDFVLFFSSLVAFARPPGQANYVAGCVFEDAFAAQCASAGVTTRVMNWGYWGHVGVGATEALRQRMANLGVGSIEPAPAMQALERLLRGPQRQLALVSVTRPLAELARGVYAAFLGTPEAAAPRAAATVKPPAPPATGDLGERLQARLRALLSEALKVAVDDIDVDEAFTGYGLDSITGVQLAQMLNQALGTDLDVTLFFDHTTVRALADHLLAAHGPAVAAALGETAPAAAAPAPALPARAAASDAPSRFLPVAADGVKGTAQTPADDDGIAIVGLSGSFPKADSAQALWRNVVEGRNCVTEVPADRWDWRQVAGDPAQPVQSECFRWGAFIDGVDRFDAGFFGISDEEAAYMAPQQRLLLTHAWKAVEDAGVAPRELAAEPTGVFIATVPSDYLNRVANAKDVPLMVTGLSTSMIPNRISQALNLRGPSEHCDTACSSALVALHRAVHAIRHGECRQAIVGAANLILTPAGYIAFEALHYLTPSGRMAAFQPTAGGFVRAESVGALLLKPLRQARADGNHVYAVIRGTGVAHGGGAVSLTTPNGNGMREAIRQAFEAARVDPRTVGYIEAHGIASPLADAIELAALKGEYQRLGAGQDGAPPPAHCVIGTSKPSVGYAEVASGLVSLVKVLMALRHATRPGVPNFDRLHENLSLRDTPFEMGAQPQPWPAPMDAQGRPLPRRAAINNYGFSGVNAHVVLEEFVPPADEPAPAGPQIVVLSAATPARLRVAARELAAALPETEAPLADIAWTLQAGRTAREHRAAFVVDDRQALAALLQQFAQAPADQPPAGVHAGRAARRPATSADDPQVQHCLQEGRLAELAALWVGGVELPWQALHAARRPRRVALPGEPMQPRRCWVPGSTGLAPLHTRRARRRGSGARTPIATPD